VGTGSFQRFKEVELPTALIFQISYFLSSWLKWGNVSGMKLAICIERPYQEPWNSFRGRTQRCPQIELPLKLSYLGFVWCNIVLVAVSANVLPDAV
jgi:hypothetical protein